MTTKRVHSATVVVATAFGLVAACQSQELSLGGGGPLQRGDVESLPSGNATGTEASGGYLFTDFAVTRCGCRDGSEDRFGCSFPWEVGADGLWLEQEDGALQINPIQSNQVDDRLSLVGGVDEDGRFEIGGTSDVVDLQMTVGQAFHFATGVVKAGDALTAQWEIRVQYLDGDEAFDCDLSVDLELLWWPPNAQGDCARDTQCHPEAPYCVSGSCSAGADGDACTFADDCENGRCADGICSDGGVGAPCTFSADCESGVCDPDGRCAAIGACGATEPCPDGMLCYEDACQTGVEGDSCETPLHCTLDHSCIEGQCWDGSEGDPCDSPIDCQFDSRNCVQSVCYDGSEGDPCDKPTECDLASGLACTNGTCQAQ